MRSKAREDASFHRDLDASGATNPCSSSAKSGHAEHDGQNLVIASGISITFHPDKMARGPMSMKHVLSVCK
jgi:hypothetical protein